MNSAPREPSLGYRPALDGLRALAVGAVLAFHLRPAAVRGGFLGVDLFFVLSGYLITTLLIDEQRRTGGIDLARFWARRMRRLLPAALLVCGAVLFATWSFSTPDTMYPVRRATVAVLAYVSNWYFIGSGEDYFDQFEAPSPLRHAWSLSIEEQFYFVWPTLGLLLLKLGRGRLRWLLVATLTLIAGSAYILAHVHMPDAPARAYFGTDARAHELLVGALLAMLLDPRYGPARAKPVLARLGWPALLVVVAAMLVLGETATAYYHGGSLTFSLTCAALIGAVEVAPDSELARGLGRAIPSWLGRLSYGIYLWHWPVSIWIAPDTTGWREPWVGLARVAVTLGLASLSYYVLERRIRAHATRRHIVTLLVGALTSALFVGLAFAATRRAKNPLWGVPDAKIEVTSPTHAQVALTLAVVGDSVVASLVPPLTAIAVERGWGMIDASRGGCGLTEVPVANDFGDPLAWGAECRRDVPDMHRRLVREHHADVIVAHSGYELFDQIGVHGGVIHAGTPEHLAIVERELRRTLDVLGSGGAKVVLLGTLPNAAPANCDFTVSRRVECYANLRRRALIPEYDRLLRRLAEERSGARSFVSAEAIVCASGPPCPRRVDGVLLRPDGFHFSSEGGRWFAPRLLSLVEAAVRLETGTLIGPPR